MKSLLKRWLGIPFDIGRRLQRLEENDLAQLQTSKPFDKAKIEQELEETRGILGALMERLEMDVRQTYKPDPQFLPPEPKMRQVYEVYPRYYCKTCRDISCPGGAKCRVLQRPPRMNHPEK